MRQGHYHREILLMQSASVTPLFILLDARDKCTDGKCIRYDPKKFAKSPSIMTYFPGGRLGNMLTTYLTLYWLKLEFGYDTYYEKEAYYVSTTFTTFLWRHIKVRFPILDISTLYSMDHKQCK